MGALLKLLFALKYPFNTFSVRLLCKKVGGNLRAVRIPIISGGGRILIGNNVFIGRNVYLIANDEDSSIEIGDNVEIRDGVRIYARNITIGSNVTLGENTFLSGVISIKSGAWVARACDISGEVEVGKCILGPFVACVSQDHRRLTDGSVCLDNKGRGEKISIEDGAWLGMRAIVLKNVTIKRNVVVGSGAVVTKTFPEGAVLVGVPARETNSYLNVHKT